MTNHRWRKYQRSKLQKYFEAYKCSECGLYKIRLVSIKDGDRMVLVDNASFKRGGVMFDGVDQEVGCDEYIVQSVIE